MEGTISDFESAGGKQKFKENLITYVNVEKDEIII